MRKQMLVSIVPLISTVTPTFVRNASKTSSLFPSQFNSYFQPNPQDMVYTYNTDIETLMKSGSVDSALQLFDQMPMRDIITYNIVISGLKRNGLSKQALYVYSQMVSQGFVESSSTFSTVLSVFSQERLYQEGLQVHNRVVVLGLSLNVYVGSALIDLYMNMGLVDIALRLFDDLPDRNLATWNQLLRGFGGFGMSQKLELYYRMKREGVVLNPVAFCYLIRSFGNESFVDHGRELHGYAIKVGWAESDLFVSNALVDFYSACGSLMDAKKSFEVIPIDDVISWNSLVSMYASNGIASNALAVFSMMQIWGKKPSVRSFVGLLNFSSRNVNIILGKQIHCFVLKLGFDHVSCYICSALIDMYGKCGEIESSVSIFESVPRKTLEVCNSLMTSFAHCGIVEDVIELFGLMVDEDIGFDEVSLSTTVNTLPMSTYAGLTSCKLLHLCAVKSGFDHDLAVSCSLIDSYSRFGDVKSSGQVFKQLSSPNVMCFTSIISAYSRNKMGTECCKILEVMINNGLKPDKVTFLCVLTACKHSGMVQEGKMVFESMKTVHGIYPESQHLACMVDLLGHKGLLEEAERLLKQTQFNNDSVIWSALLRHCRAYHNETIRSLEIEDDEKEFLDLPSCSSEYGIKNLVNVDSFGAAGDGVSDDTKAFANAWKQACSTAAAVLLVPPDRTYLVNATRFRGPCAEDLIVQIDGNIVAPDEPKKWDPKNPRNWLYFSNLKGVTFQGHGVIDGSGRKWWAASCKKNKTNPCVGAPTALTIDQSSNIEVNGLTIRNSQQMHFTISRSESDSKIGTGDDCISIVNGCSNIKMKSIYCGPGHGISIGSLGKDNSTEFVTAVVLDTAFLKGTMNGLRIKTWQGGSGYVRAVRYKNVQMHNVSNPIIIDQFYCDSPKSCQNQTSAVEISQIIYENISGTSKSPNAMKFACSDTVPCTNIVLNNINLKRTDGKSAHTLCNSVMGFAIGYVQPSADCLTAVNNSLCEAETEFNREYLIHSEL
ncbi:hypothetical protein M8C21_031220 [Ambrosia artemisiifolia]|uniref:Polygalacturonase n=1 Tax=Ambrosia artemisiifolia TaxID=4212 RepID=A0AAD5G1D1_AMBAR|nr:hypothetical protein M8C21_031220 [Ambrosia artemisiifolia]